ncbi:hypothetical protein F5Y16DRAFT_385035 [Xylariaceae sp. FL0255]|nr:hypothetical protein F5Y16DRAFT_385035 [Xylariaceae sp. FL0255]
MGQYLLHINLADRPLVTHLVSRSECICIYLRRSRSDHTCTGSHSALSCPYPFLLFQSFLPFTFTIIYLIMLDPKSISELFSLLKDKYHVTSKTLETPFGLILEITPEGTFIAKLKSGAVQASDTIYHENLKESSFRYRLFPEYQTGFLWYDKSWHGNPKDEYMVDEDDLEARYGRFWHEDIYQPWVDRWSDSFRKNCNDTGDFYAHVFSNEDEEKAWVLEGVLLATWLTLQPDVVSVEYSPHSSIAVFRTEELGQDISLFLDNLHSHIQFLSPGPRAGET